MGFEPVLGYRGAHLRSGADRAQGVVLVRDRYPEDSHDRISRELLHNPAVLLDDRAEVLEVAAHAGAQRLRVGRLAERGRADEVAEEDGDDLALLARHLCGRERRPAGIAEARVLGILVSAARAGNHWRSLGPSLLRDNPRGHLPDGQRLGVGMAPGGIEPPHADSSPRKLYASLRVEMQGVLFSPV
jgi:hypothetical protein